MSNVLVAHLGVANPSFALLREVAARADERPGLPIGLLAATKPSFDMSRSTKPSTAQ
ncbi:hypothetical protein [Nocardia sp. XZ_19_369]|uniref:hypothetical protein n=1 Tax=Nocardia sp. XZ_19_369 TaxID=2769487 RepID=UPI00188DC7B4|nr:hypothetical protein [Nocardia sp. XZ_19_369]